MASSLQSVCGGRVPEGVLDAGTLSLPILVYSPGQVNPQKIVPTQGEDEMPPIQAV